jgi:hypothetical protein
MAGFPSRMGFICRNTRGMNFGIGTGDLDVLVTDWTFGQCLDRPEPKRLIQDTRRDWISRFLGD